MPSSPSATTRASSESSSATRGAPAGGWTATSPCRTRTCFREASRATSGRFDGWSSPAQVVSAVGVRLHRNAVVGVARPELVRRGADQLQALGRAPGSLDLEIEIGDRAVQRVVLGPLRVGVDPGDEVPRLGRPPTPDLYALAGDLERAARRLLGQLRRQGAVEPAEAMLYGADAQHPVGHPGSPHGT